MRSMMIGAVVFGLVAGGCVDSTATEDSERPTAHEQDADAVAKAESGTLAPPTKGELQRASRPTADAGPVRSLLGEVLVPVPIEPERLAKLQQDLKEANDALGEDSIDEDAIIWLGRRKAYLGDYRGAIGVYNFGLRFYPDSARLLRHQGHRLITVRDLERAELSLNLAARLVEDTFDEVEPDGQPNAAGIPTSTLHTNIWYHLGLAQYLQGDFQSSRDSYAKCLAISGNDDMQAAASYWLYLNNRRLGDDDAAKQVLDGITADMNIIENETYQRLLLLYKGQIKPEDVPGTVPSAVGETVDDATMAYGVAMWHLFNGREDEARARFEKIAGKDRAPDAAWAAFGYIAAEAELARPKDSPQRAAEERGRDGG